MRKDFMVERQGKTFCLYAGLLDLAHQTGLLSIKTSLVQIPSEANNRTAICTAVVTMIKDGVEKEFTGIGDAAPNNVAPAMQNCLIRMAETRAKARALRDAVNIGVAAFEELGDVDAHDGAPERGYATGGYVRNGRPQRGQDSMSQPPPALKSSPPQQRENASESEATTSQMEAIRSLCKRQSIEPEAFAKETLNSPLESLSQTQASELIKQLNSKRQLQR